MAKIAARFFQQLRTKVMQKYPVPRPVDKWDKEVKKERNEWVKAKARKKVQGLSITKLREIAIMAYMGAYLPYNEQVSDDDFSPKQPVDKFKAQRETLLKKIEKAELLSMAGDNAAANALIQEIVG